MSLRRDELLECGESMCPICQEDFSGPIKLRCQVIIHFSCMKKNMKLRMEGGSWEKGKVTCGEK